MTCRLGFVALAIAIVAAAGSHGGVTAAQAPKQGTIKGHVRLSGKPPGNPVIRMGMDPKCSQLNAGKRTVQEAVAASADGSLANVFVRLQGSFPSTPVSAEPVTLDQQACVYTPRVVGVRVGQVLQVRNSDELFHNVHGLSVRGNGFNVAEPLKGMVQQFRPKDEEIMLRVKCDLHSWMIAFVGVVSHPYFATSGVAGTFVINNVPPGNYSILAWHERYGVISMPVRVTAGQTATVDFTYTGSEKPTASGVRDLILRGN